MRDLRVQVASSPDRDDVEVELLIADEVAGTLYESPGWQRTRSRLSAHPAGAWLDTGGARERHRNDVGPVREPRPKAGVLAT